MGVKINWFFVKSCQSFLTKLLKDDYILIMDYYFDRKKRVISKNKEIEFFAELKKITSLVYFYDFLVNLKYRELVKKDKEVVVELKNFLQNKIKEQIDKYVQAYLEYDLELTKIREKFKIKNNVDDLLKEIPFKKPIGEYNPQLFWSVSSRVPGFAEKYRQRQEELKEKRTLAKSLAASKLYNRRMEILKEARGLILGVYKLWLEYEVYLHCFHLIRVNYRVYSNMFFTPSVVNSRATQNAFRFIKTIEQTVVQLQEASQNQTELTNLQDNLTKLKQKLGFLRNEVRDLSIVKNTALKQSKKFLNYFKQFLIGKVKKMRVKYKTLLEELDKI